MIIHIELTGGTIKDTLVSVKNGMISGIHTVASTLASVPYKRIHITDVRDKAPKTKARKAVALTAEA